MMLDYTCIDYTLLYICGTSIVTHSVLGLIFNEQISHLWKFVWFLSLLARPSIVDPSCFDSCMVVCDGALDQLCLVYFHFEPLNVHALRFAKPFYMCYVLLIKIRRTAEPFCLEYWCVLWLYFIIIATCEFCKSASSTITAIFYLFWKNLKFLVSSISPYQNQDNVAETVKYMNFILFFLSSLNVLILPRLTDLSFVVKYLCFTILFWCYIHFFKIF